MTENINDKLSKILSGIDKNKLKNSTGAISKLMSSEAGQKLKNSLSEEDKKRILQKFMAMDPSEVSKKLNNADLSNLDNLSADDIMKKLR